MTSSWSAVRFFFFIEITWFLFWYLIYLNTPPGGTPPGKAVMLLVNGAGLFIISFAGIVYSIKKLPEGPQQTLLSMSQVILLVLIVIAAA